jgi:hypothetical protein
MYLEGENQGFCPVPWLTCLAVLAGLSPVFWSGQIKCEYVEEQVVPSKKAESLHSGEPHPTCHWGRVEMRQTLASCPRPPTDSS